jgi:hypothetical protein
VELHRQRLQPAVEVIADVGLEAQHSGRLHPSPDQDERGLDYTQRER